MKRILTICLVLLLCASAYGTKVKDTTIKLGSFTGPVNGTAQDDNVKASLDILHALIGPSMIKGQGSIFYVDSGVASTAGTSWATAVGTLDEAINLCTEDRGDVILIAEGHTEVLAGADAANFDIAGITVIGLGIGEQAPVFDVTTNGELVIGDDDTKLYNLVFKAHSPDTAHAIDVETGAAQFVIENCRFIVDTEGTDEFTDAIEIAANSDYGVIQNCIFQQGGGAADTAISYVGADAIRIINNEFYGDYAVGCLESQTTISLGGTIINNICYNGDTGAIGLNTQPCMELKSDDTGVIAGNACFCDVATPEDAIVADDMHLANNTYSETESADGGSTIIGLAGAPGSKFIVVIDVNSHLLPNGTQTGAAITGASTGALILENISISTDATGFAGPTNIELTCDNTYGLTGANGILMLEAVTGLGANLCWTLDEATSEELPFHLESGKKLFMHGDDGAGTGDKLQKVILYFIRVDAGANIAGLSPAPA